jgi:hypothetical protein
MRAWLIACALLCTAAACGDDEDDAPIMTPIAGNGRSGSGAGTGGAANQPEGGRTGVAGSDSPRRECLPADGDLVLMTLEGERVAERLEAIFHVASSEFMGDRDYGTLRLEVVGIDPDLDAGLGDASHVIELSATALPRDLVRPGDVLDIAYTPNRGAQATTFIASRDGSLAFFHAASLGVTVDQTSLWPELERHDVVLATGDPFCAISDLSARPCIARMHSLRATHGEETGTASETGLLLVGDLTVMGIVYEELPESERACFAGPAALKVTGFLKRP